ncbi:MAG: oligosaccharide flippase family protein, partial [Chitinophagaceae bacterium]|nr:oligosaccharide flippase family protein [Chitinophagaceae bacterium]
MKSLKPNFLYHLLTSFLYSVTPVIIFPYISRLLGPENIGKINLIDYTAQFISLFAWFGIPLYGVREVGRLRNNPSELKKVISELLFIHIIISLIGLIVFIILIILNKNVYSDKNLVILSAVNILITAFTLEWVVQGLEDFAFVGKRFLISKLLSITIIFLLVKQRNDYVLYYFILICTNMVVVVLDIVYVLRNKINFVKGIR